MTSTKTIPILILDDGVTWSGVDGTSFCLISKEEHERLIDETIEPSELTPILELGLKDYTLS
jgi:hypothetical protein